MEQEEQKENKKAKKVNQQPYEELGEITKHFDFDVRGEDEYSGDEEKAHYGYNNALNRKGGKKKASSNYNVEEPYYSTLERHEQYLSRQHEYPVHHNDKRYASEYHHEELEWPSIRSHHESYDLPIERHLEDGDHFYDSQIYHNVRKLGDYSHAEERFDNDDEEDLWYKQYEQELNEPTPVEEYYHEEPKEYYTFDWDTRHSEPVHE